MTLLWVIMGLIVLVVVYIWSLYNDLVREAMEIDEAWGQIDVQLKRRADLIPNLVETVKGYVKHEKGVLESVTKARSALMHADTPGKMAQAHDMLSGALKSLFAVAEAYPKLQANENFLQLQKELSDTEDKVAYARQYYNTQVMEYNIKIKSFPAMLIGEQMGYGAKDFFKAIEEERKSVKVEFN